MLKMALTNLGLKGSYGNHGPSIKPFLMFFFVSVLTRFSRKHLLHPIGNTKGTKTEGNNSIWRHMKWEKNSLWVLRWKRWLTCLNKLLFHSSVCKKYILLLASGGDGNSGDRGGVIWGGNSHWYWRPFGKDTWLGGWCCHGEEDGPSWCSCRRRMQDARRMAAKL